MNNHTGTRHAGKTVLTLLLCLTLCAAALLPAFALGPVKTLKASSVTESSITLRWSAVKNATGYQLQQYKEKTWTQIRITAKGETTVKKLSAGTAYAFRVRAVKDGETGAFSAVLRVRTKPAQVREPAAKSVKPTQVKLQWNKVKGAEGYRVQQYIDKTWKTVFTTEKRSAAIRDLSPDTVYRFRVAAFLKNGTKTVFGKNSAVCKVKTASLPVGPSQEKQPSLYQKYDKMFQGGTFYMVFTTNDPELGDAPITAAMKNGSVVVDSVVQGYRIRLLYDAKKDRTYLLVPALRAYTCLSENMMDDMDLRHSLIEITAPTDATDAVAYETKLDGKTYTVEAFRTADGETRYYFQGETLVRIDAIGTDGTVTSTFVQTLTDKVPDSLFEIPRNYRYLDLSWLELF